MSVRLPIHAPPQPGTEGRLPDLIFGTGVGLLCVGLKSYWAIVLTLAHSPAASTIDMGRLTVWGLMMIPAAAYFSLMAAYGASALWEGAPEMRWFTRIELRELLTPLPADEITAAQAAGRGALGGILGLATVSIIPIALLVLCLFMMFLGPGPAILLLWLGVTLAAVAASLLWGAVIGSLIFCRHRFGWPAGAGVSFGVIVICSVIVGLAV